MVVDLRVKRFLTLQCVRPGLRAGVSQPHRHLVVHRSMHGGVIGIRNHGRTFAVLDHLIPYFLVVELREVTRDDDSFRYQMSLSPIGQPHLVVISKERVDFVLSESHVCNIQFVQTK